MIYGYARVSSKQQNLDRQLIALKESGCEKIYAEKQSGADFNSRQVYKSLCNKLIYGDTLIIASIDRLGRNYQEILEQWRKIINKGCDLKVLDMPILNTKNGVDGLDGRFIADLVLQILSYVAEKEREKIKARQAEGIKIAKEKGIRFGRPKKEWDLSIIQEYKNKRANSDYYIKAIGCSKAQFFRLVKEEMLNDK